MGEMDEDFYYGFSDRINQNLRGHLKPSGDASPISEWRDFWRVLAFDRYTGQGWGTLKIRISHGQASQWHQFYLPQIFN
jgi:hypothetical protein